MSTIPRIGCPSTTSDSEIAQSGLSLLKLIVPSIGSSTQRGPASARPPPSSSPEKRDLRRGAGKQGPHRGFDMEIDVGGEIPIALGDQGADVGAARAHDLRAAFHRLLGREEKPRIDRLRARSHRVAGTCWVMQWILPPSRVIATSDEMLPARNGPAIVGPTTGSGGQLRMHAAETMPRFAV